MKFRIGTTCFAMMTLLSITPAFAEDEAFAANKRLGRGVNMGNMLEAPREGEWGLKLDETWFQVIKDAGFDHARIPIKWSAHASNEPPYRIEPTFLDRIDRAVESAHFVGLNIVLNVHHFDGMDADPEKWSPKLVAIWKQLAEHYKPRGSMVYFELDNEPHDKLTTEKWNAVVPKILSAIRATNPERFVIVGPGMWNGFRELPKLKLPEDDRRLIVTFHYYEPFEFTHQGAEWAKGSEKWLGRKWTASEKELAEMRKAFDSVAKWSKEHNRPIYLGEFGSYSKADLDSRITWTKAVATEAARRGFSLAYWEFGAGFGLYDPQAKAWRTPLRDSVLRSASDE